MFSSTITTVSSSILAKLTYAYSILLLLVISKYINADISIQISEYVSSTFFVLSNIKGITSLSS